MRSAPSADTRCQRERGIMTLIEIRKADGTLVGRCDARCYNAIGSLCECCCGGKNHGRGVERAVAQTREQAFTMIPEHWKGLGEPMIPVLETDERKLQEQIARSRLHRRPILGKPSDLRGARFFVRPLIL
jgi:hypothetical protein